MHVCVRECVCGCSTLQEWRPAQRVKHRWVIFYTCGLDFFTRTGLSSLLSLCFTLSSAHYTEIVFVHKLPPGELTVAQHSDGWEQSNLAPQGVATHLLLSFKCFKHMVVSALPDGSTEIQGNKVQFSHWTVGGGTGVSFSSTNRSSLLWYYYNLPMSWAYHSNNVVIMVMVMSISSLFH